MLRVVTCVSDRAHPGLRSFLEASCRHYALELTILEHRGSWSHRVKDHALLGFLARVGKNDIVLFSDGYDTALLATEAEILERYESAGTEVLFSAETNCWPYRGLRSKYPTSRSQYRYLNSGGFVGRAQVIRELLERYPKPPSEGLIPQLHDEGTGSGDGPSSPDEVFRGSNQYYWTCVFLKHPEAVTLDYRRALFQTFATEAETWMKGAEEFRRLAEGSALYQVERAKLSAEWRLGNGHLIHDGEVVPARHVHFNGPVARLLAVNGCFDGLFPWRSAS